MYNKFILVENHLLSWKEYPFQQLGFGKTSPRDVTSWDCWQVWKSSVCPHPWGNKVLVHVHFLSQLVSPTRTTAKKSWSFFGFGVRTIAYLFFIFCSPDRSCNCLSFSLFSSLSSCLINYFCSIPNPRDPTRFILFTGFPQDFFFHIMSHPAVEKERRKKKVVFFKHWTKTSIRIEKTPWKLFWL